MSAGIYRLPNGTFRVVACISRTQRREKRFPANTAPRTMTNWRKAAEADLRREPVRLKGSLLDDLEVRYLPAVAGMPTLTTRERHLRLWCTALGERRSRDTVTAPDIRAVLEQWQLTAGWSKAYCNRFRTALMSFYTVLDGKSGANPVRDVPKYREKKHPPKRLDYPTFEAILAAMPDRGQPLRGETRAEVSRTKARLRLIAYTGLPHAQVMRLVPGHVRWAERLLYVEGRDKGDGTDDQWLPLSGVGMVALTAFAEANAWGPFSTSAMRTSFRLAAGKIGRTDLTPYDLRHLFGTTVLRLTRNRAATRDLMLHTTDVTTARYTAAAIPVELRAALDAFDAEVSPK